MPCLGVLIEILVGWNKDALTSSISFNTMEEDLLYLACSVLWYGKWK